MKSVKKHVRKVLGFGALLGGRGDKQHDRQKPWGRGTHDLPVPISIPLSRGTLAPYND